MGYLEMLAAFVSICQSALNMGKTLAPNLKRLSQEEIQLLQAAEDGYFLLVNGGHILLLYAGGRFWGDSDQPETTARFLDAFEHLCARGLIRHLKENRFQLTGAGFQLRKRLLAEPRWRRLLKTIGRWFSWGR